jgi:hypothetical protein
MHRCTEGDRLRGRKGVADVLDEIWIQEVAYSFKLNLPLVTETCPVAAVPGLD